MRPSSQVLSKASRRPLLSNRASKDYYKGSQQARLPGRGRTGAPGVYWRNGGGYRLLDEKVRVFVAPPVDVLNSSELRPYVSLSVNLKRAELGTRLKDFPGPRVIKTGQALIERSQVYQNLQKEAKREVAGAVGEPTTAGEAWGEEFLTPEEKKKRKLSS